MKRIFKDYQLIKNNYITKKYPISLVHFVTNRCNARCSFCFIDFDNPETFKGELTLDEIEKFSKTIGPSIQNINLTGGEPFARKEFSDICKIYLKNTDIRSLFITSNGSLPDRIDKFLDELAKNLDKLKKLGRQNFEKEITPSGGFYIARWDSFLQRKTFYTNKTLSFEVDEVSGIEIDEILDWEFAEFLIIKQNEIKK